jgi:hypothetical protein
MEARLRKFLLRHLGTIALLIACAGSARAQSNVAEALQTSLPPGWECLQGPNELDRPGRAFYVDPKGVRYELIDLHDRLKPTSGEVASTAARASGYVTAGLMASMLNMVGLSLSGTTKYASTVILLQRHEERTEEADVRAALRTIDPSLIDAQNSYFVIRNVQIAKEMKLTVDRSIAGSFGGDVPFRNLFKVSGAATDPSKQGDAAKASSAPATNPPAIAAEDDKTFTIDQTFTKPLTVCYLAQRFTLKNVGAGAGGSIRDAQLVEEYWHPYTEK